MKDKVIVFRYIKIVLISICLFFISLVIYDPMQLFHKHILKENKNKFISDMRNQAAGIINNYDFDSIILGTSMLENTSSQEASIKLNGEFINISPSGSTFNERSVILKKALKEKKLKYVIYSLDAASIIKHTERATTNFDYLYDDNPFNDINIYLNHKYLQCLGTASFESQCLGGVRDLDRPNAWHKKPKYIQRYGGLQNWFKHKNEKQIKESFDEIIEIGNKIKNNQIYMDKDINNTIAITEKYFDDTVLKHIIKYPNTEFILIFPPYSRVEFAIYAQYYKSEFEIFKHMTKYIVEKSTRYKNLKVYAWGNHTFVDDIANYKDLRHYEYKINSWMLDAISREEGLLTATNLNSYLDEFSTKSSEFNLIKFAENIEKNLKDNNDQ